MKISHDQMVENHFRENSGAICTGYYNKSFDESNIDETGYRPYVVDVTPLPINVPTEILQKEPPNDKWHVLRIILTIQGLATLMPWNMFINAQSYFQDYKLPSTNGTDDTVKNYHDDFMSYVTVCSMIPSISFSAINTFITRSSVASPVRMIVAKFLMIALLAVTIVLAALDTSEYMKIFFIVTMLTVVLMNSDEISREKCLCPGSSYSGSESDSDSRQFLDAASSIFQSSLYGICSILPSQYITAVIFGSNIAGILTSMASIISIASQTLTVIFSFLSTVSSNARTSAFFYFSTAIITLIVALITNRLFQKLPLYLFYKNKVLNISNPTVNQSRPPFWKIFKKIWFMCFNVWLTFAVTILNFPNVTSQVKRINFPIDDINWIPVWCFLNFNIFAVLGTLPSYWTQWPGPKILWIVVIIRGLFFLPFFILGNYIPNERTMPTYFANDYVYIVGIMLLAATNSHLNSLCFIHTPSLLRENEAAVGGMMLNIFLFLGILSGGIISFTFKPLLNCC